VQFWSVSGVWVGLWGVWHILVVIRALVANGSVSRTGQAFGSGWSVAWGIGVQSHLYSVQVQAGLSFSVPLQSQKGESTPGQSMPPRPGASSSLCSFGACSGPGCGLIYPSSYSGISVGERYVSRTGQASVWLVYWSVAWGIGVQSHLYNAQVQAVGPSLLLLYLVGSLGAGV